MYLVYHNKLRVFVLDPEHNGTPKPRLFYSIKGANKFIEDRVDKEHLEVREHAKSNGQILSLPVDQGSGFFKKTIFKLKDTFSSFKD